MLRVKSLTLFDTEINRVEIMYIKKVSIKNIRSIDHFEMEFEEPAGWHVIIGDNGVGKSTVVKAISLALLYTDGRGISQSSARSWLRRGEKEGAIELKIQRNNDFDGEDFESFDFSNLNAFIRFFEIKDDFGNPRILDSIRVGRPTSNDEYTNWGRKGWFSAGFGPFRRLGVNKATEIDDSRKSAHLSLFQDIPLTEALTWLKNLDHQRLIEKEKNNGLESTKTYNNVLKFINDSHLLPHGAQVEGVDKDGLIFYDGLGNRIPVLELSDGYRSVLSLIFELIRQLVHCYGSKSTFTNIENGQMYIDLPGVVLIDEVDAHLHPSWQTRIGQWFTKYFPNIQFIVTTHSPLVCRASEKGSIWRLAAPGSGEESGEITGLARKRLIYGNILDAYGTEVFGDNVSISEDAALMRNRLGELYEKSMLGEITKKEEVEFEKLKAILPTFKVNIPNPQ